MGTENDKPDGDKPEGEGESTPEKPSFMTAAEFNKAVTAREKRLTDRLEKAFEDRLAKALAAKKPDPEPDPEPDDEPDDGAAAKPAGAAPDATAKQIANLQRQLTRERNEREKREAADREKDAKIARDEERAKLADAFTMAGGDPDQTKLIVALLHTEEKRVRRNEEGKIVFVTEDEEEMDLAAGIKAFLASDYGKRFVKARGAQGAGTKPGNRPGGTSGNGNPKPTKADLGRVLLRGLTSG